LGLYPGPRVANLENVFWNGYKALIAKYRKDFLNSETGTTLIFWLSYTYRPKPEIYGQYGKEFSKNLVNRHMPQSLTKLISREQ
jgi:hypothetical protein